MKNVIKEGLGLVVMGVCWLFIIAIAVVIGMLIGGVVITLLIWGYASMGLFGLVLAMMALGLVAWCVAYG